MTNNELLKNNPQFSKVLFEKMQALNPGIGDLELYEFRYCLNNITPDGGDWSSVSLPAKDEIEGRVNDMTFYKSISIKPRIKDHIVLDPQAVSLTRQLLVGLATDVYSAEWIVTNFYFDIRGFIFLHRTEYFTDRVMKHLGGKPFKQFEPKQKLLVRNQDVGYKEFSEANAEVDQSFIDLVQKMIEIKGTPILLAIAGPTAAGKTEIVDRLHQVFALSGKKTTSIELDNFLTDRDQREEKGIHSLGRAALHFDLLKKCLADITAGRKIATPRYDFIDATSSHDLDGRLKPAGRPIEIEPADIIFMEGNSPFLYEEIAPMVGIKAVYLTDDEIRIKRKWKRDIDYRKKYDPAYFCNRFFKDQFIMAHEAYRPQLELCDIAVDTTNAALWVTPEMVRLFSV